MPNYTKYIGMNLTRDAQDCYKENFKLLQVEIKKGQANGDI